MRAGLAGACSRYGLTGFRLLRFAGICSSRDAEGGAGPGPPAGAEGRAGEGRGGSLQAGGVRGGVTAPRALGNAV